MTYDRVIVWVLVMMIGFNLSFCAMATTGKRQEREYEISNSR
jgi:hypothetical protein